MSISLLLSVFLTLCIAPYSPMRVKNWASAPENDQQKALTNLEQHWLEQEDNPDALESILASDFVHVLPSGFITKSEQLTYMRAHPVHRAVSKHFENLRVRIYGNAGVVNGIVVATTADGKTRRTEFTDVFAYRNGKWEAVNAQELPLPEPVGP